MNAKTRKSLTIATAALGLVALAACSSADAAPKNDELRELFEQHRDTICPTYVKAKETLGLEAAENIGVELLEDNYDGSITGDLETEALRLVDSCQDASSSGTGEADEATPAATDKPAATAPEATAPAATAPPATAPPPTAPPATAPAALMPDVVCMDLQAAQNEIQRAGVFFSGSHDATGQDRMQLIDSNWQVVAQTPSPGTPIGENDAVLDVVKFGEPSPC
jgi:hypothetical protein